MMVMMHPATATGHIATIWGGRVIRAMIHNQMKYVFACPGV